MENKKIAFFDFDGTITFKDSMFDFLIKSFGYSKLFFAFFVLSPVLFLHKTGFVGNKKAKEVFLSFFFKGISRNTYLEMCNNYSEEIDKITRSDALETIDSLKSKGYEIVIVTASIEDWVIPWANKRGIKVLGTVFESNYEIMGGKIVGENCYGINKVKKIKENFNIEEYQNVLAFGDTKGDYPMLELGNNYGFRVFVSEK